MANTSIDPTFESPLKSFADELGALSSEYESVVGAGAPRTGDGRAPLDTESYNLSAVLQIPVEVKAVLGSASVAISSLMKMRRGSVLPLDRRVGEPIELMVNGRVVARGEVVVLEDGVPRLGISLTEIVGRYGGQADDQGLPRPTPALR
jgi:flagellar motor switch protein FliN